jgi:hypothetical protein
MHGNACVKHEFVHLLSAGEEFSVNADFKICRLFITTQIFLRNIHISTVRANTYSPFVG